MTENKKKTVEEYERLAARLAEDRDTARDVSHRLAREKKVLEGELKPLLERLLALLTGEHDPAQGHSFIDTTELYQLKQTAAWYGVIVAALNGETAGITQTIADARLGPIPEEVSIVISLILDSRLRIEAAQRRPRRSKRPLPRKKSRRRR